MSKYDLNKHKKSDKIKWIITGVFIVLLSVMVAGLCMQLFAKDDKYKPSEWFNKPDTEQTQPAPDNGENDKETATYAVSNHILKATSATVDSNSGISTQSNLAPLSDYLNESSFQYGAYPESKISGSTAPYKNLDIKFRLKNGDTSGDTAIFIPKSELLDADKFITLKSDINLSDYVVSGVYFTDGSSGALGTNAFPFTEYDDYYVYVVHMPEHISGYRVCVKYSLGSSLKALYPYVADSIPFYCNTVKNNITGEKLDISDFVEYRRNDDMMSRGHAVGIISVNYLANCFDSVSNKEYRIKRVFLGCAKGAFNETIDSSPVNISEYEVLSEAEIIDNCYVIEYYFGWTSGVNRVIVEFEEIGSSITPDPAPDSDMCNVVFYLENSIYKTMSVKSGTSFIMPTTNTRMLVATANDIEIDSVSQYLITYTTNVEFNCKVINNVYPTAAAGTSGLFYHCKKDSSGNIGLLISKDTARTFFPSYDFTNYTLSGVSLRIAGESEDFATFSEIAGDYYFLHIPVTFTSEKVLCINYIANGSAPSTSEPIPLPSNPVKEGYTFKGWYYDRNFDVPYDGEPIYADTALYAKFEINQYNVLFNRADGSLNPTSITVDWNTPVTVFTPTREKYAFKGWFMADGTEYTNQPVTADLTLTAHWERNVFTVTFNTDGGSLVVSQEITLNNTVTLPTTEKTGYNLIGWFMADGTEYTNQPITSDIELTARWEVQTFTVTFYIGDEVYTTKTVNYGTPLIKVVESANELSLRVLTVRSANGTFDDIKNATVTDDSVEIVAEELTGTDKVINTVKNNKWAIIGGVAGGFALIAILGAIIGGTKRRKR